MAVYLRSLLVWVLLCLIISVPLLTLSGNVAVAEPLGSGDSMQMTPDGADKKPNETSDQPQLGGPNTGLTNDNLKDQSDKDKKDQEAKDNGDAPPTEDCGMVDPGCWTNNALITFVWWVIRAPSLFLQELITGFEGMGFALPDPSGELLDKYDQVAEKVRPMVLVGMLITGGLMLARSANFHAAYLLQSGLPKIGLAVLGLAFFPQLATLIADISNGLATSFYQDAEVTKMFSKLLNETIIAQIVAFLAVLLTPASWGILGIMALVFLGPVLVLVLLLFVITYMNGLFFSLLIMTGPIALVCYAVPGLQSVTEVWFKGILASAILPIIFSIEIMLMSWAGGSPEAVGPGGGTASLIVCVLLLWIMVKSPGKVYHWAYGSMGGGHGGGFLAGMGMRSLLRKGAQVAAGAASGGAGLAAAGAAGAAGGVAGSAAGGAGGAMASGTATQAIKAAGNQFGENAHGSWGSERLKQHGTSRQMKQTMEALNGQEGAFRAIRQTGESGLSAQNKIDDLKAQVLGGDLSEQDFEQQKDNIQDGNAQDKQTLAQNLAQSNPESGVGAEDYKKLIDAEEDAQLRGQGSQVAPLETPSTSQQWDSGEPDGQNSVESSADREAERLQDYTANVAGEQSAGENGLTTDENRNTMTTEKQGPSTGPDQSAEPPPPSTNENPGQTQETTRAGEAGYTPPRNTEQKLTDDQKGKAAKLTAMLAQNPDARKAFKRAQSEDKNLRDAQGKVSHDAMRGEEPKGTGKGGKGRSPASRRVAGLQSQRDTNLNAAATDLAQRYHNSQSSSGAGPKMSRSDVRQILGAKFDYAYDEPAAQPGGQPPSYGGFQERVSGPSPDGNLDGPGNGNIRGRDEGKRSGYRPEHLTDYLKEGNRENEDSTPDYERGGRE